MHKNILVDLNVILDVLLERRGYQSSQAVLESSLYKIFISAHIVTTFAYLLENAKVPLNEIKRNIDWLLNTFVVVATTDIILSKALKSDVVDFEDAVIEQAALNCEAEAIITRNVKDFTKSTIPALTPEAFMA